jgi:hypothetical protein
MNIGKVDSSVKAFHWFGRPLLLSLLTTRPLAKDRLLGSIESELAHGCDGFVFRLSSKLTDEYFGERMDLLDRLFGLFSKRAFLHIELELVGGESKMLELLRQHSFPRGYVIASRKPETLVELFRLAPKSSLCLALIVETEKGFSGLDRCPYSAVEITDALASHDRILKIHSSMKEVFVRAKFDKVSNEKGLKSIEKRAHWLKHEEVDAIISDSTDLLSTVLGLSAETQPDDGTHPTPRHAASHEG